MSFCNKCGCKLPEGSSFCPKCGAQVEVYYTSDTLPKKCPSCGAPIEDGCYFCVKCGYSLKVKTDDQYDFNNQYVNMNINYSYEKPKKKRWLAIVLCLFLGVFGIHRFYEGKKWTGVLYFFTGGLFTVGVFYDFIRIIFSNHFE